MSAAFAFSAAQRAALVAALAGRKLSRDACAPLIDAVELTIARFLATPRVPAPDEKRLARVGAAFGELAAALDKVCRPGGTDPTFVRLQAFLYETAEDFAGLPGGSSRQRLIWLADFCDKAQTAVTKNRYDRQAIKGGDAAWLGACLMDAWVAATGSRPGLGQNSPFVRMLQTLADLRVDKALPVVTRETCEAARRARARFAADLAIHEAAQGG